MIATKDIYMNICNSQQIGHQLTDEELHKLQTHLMKMYKELEAVCDKHGLKICLAYGNVLGAKRHHGWIPWDDDLDVHMPRTDYEKLLTMYADELPSNYKVYSVYSPSGPIARFAKIIDTSTTFVPLGETKTEHSGVFIDIFPVDSVGTSSIINKLKRTWAFFMMYTATSVMQVENASEEYKQIMFTSKSGRCNWYFRQMWGRIFSFASSKRWHIWIDRFSRHGQSTDYSHVVPDLPLCFRPMKTDVFFPPTKIQLLETSVYLPHKAEQYLDAIYGDWHQIPQMGDRWHHYVSEIKIQ